MNALDSKGKPVFPEDYVIAYGNLYKVVHVNTGSTNARIWIESDSIRFPDTQTMSNHILKVSTEDVLIMKLKETI